MSPQNDQQKVELMSNELSQTDRVSIMILILALAFLFVWKMF